MHGKTTVWQFESVLTFIMSVISACYCYTYTWPSHGSVTATTHVEEMPLHDSRRHNHNGVNIKPWKNATDQIQGQW